MMMMMIMIVMRMMMMLNMMMITALPKMKTNIPERPFHHDHRNRRIFAFQSILTKAKNVDFLCCGAQSRSPLCFIFTPHKMFFITDFKTLPHCNKMLCRKK